MRRDRAYTPRALKLPNEQPPSRKGLACEARRQGLHLKRKRISGPRRNVQNIGQSPTQALVKSIISTIECLANQGVIDAETTTFLLREPEEVRPQLMYFLKKIHKNPMGVRPICSALSGFTESLSKIVDTIIQPIVPTLPSFVKDSGNFCKIIEKSLVRDNAILVALDLKSLYPP